MINNNSINYDCSGNELFIYSTSDEDNNNINCNKSPSDSSGNLKKKSCSNNNCEESECLENIDSFSNSNLDFCMPKCKNDNKSIIVNERKLVDKMIHNYYNPKSIAIKDNRCILKKLIPIYRNLIDVVFNFTEKICKLRHNINVTKSGKIFRVVYDSYKTIVYNFYKSFTSILNIKYNGNDILEYTMNNVISSDNNRINYASCNNFYETDSSLEKSTLFYSIPGFTLLFNNDTLSFRLISKKSNCYTRDRVYKYDFLLIPGNNNNCNRINKISFLRVLESIASFKNDRSNNILEFINFLYHESSNIKCIL
jgi:hypothetical protein